MHKRLLKVVWAKAMIHGFCSNGLLDDAFATLSKMKDNCCIPNAVTYEIIIHFLFDKDENDKAEKFFREMILRGML
jgi:pentatricopeptide repeat protein